MIVLVVILVVLIFLTGFKLTIKTDHRHFSFEIRSIWKCITTGIYKLYSIKHRNKKR